MFLCDGHLRHEETLQKARAEESCSNCEVCLYFYDHQLTESYVEFYVIICLNKHDIQLQH